MLSEDDLQKLSLGLEEKIRSVLSENNEKITKVMFSVFVTKDDLAELPTKKDFLNLQ